MGIHYREFEEMFSCLENEIPISLTEAVDKWNHIKDTGINTMKEWLIVLENKTKDYIKDGYSVGTAMIEVWNSSYEGITEDSERTFFHISDLRDEFFDNSIDKLEACEDDLIEKAGRCPCKDCGWYVLDDQKKKGYCNNFSIERNLDDRCISEEE